jgi:ABC-type Fe3+ transport system permease subunit
MGYQAVKESKAKRSIFLLSVVILLLPPFVQLGVWWDLSSRWNLSSHGIVFGAFVLGLQLWPLLFFWNLYSMRRISKSCLEATYKLLPASKIWRGVVVPVLLPQAILGNILIFILALNNFIVPTTFQISTQIEEVFVSFSSYYDVTKAFKASIPLGLISLLLLVVLSVCCRKYSLNKLLENEFWDPNRGSKLLPPLLPRGMGICAGISILCLSLLPPVWRTMDSLQIVSTISVWKLSASHFSTSFILGLGSALASGCVAWVLWYSFQRSTWNVIIDGICFTIFVYSGMFLVIGDLGIH